MIKVVTMDGMEILLNPVHIVIAGPVNADGQPMIGMTKLLLVNGASVVVRLGMEELNATIQSAAGSRSLVLA